MSQITIFKLLEIWLIFQGWKKYRENLTRKGSDLNYQISKYQILAKMAILKELLDKLKRKMEEMEIIINIMLNCSQLIFTKV